MLPQILKATILKYTISVLILFLAPQVFSQVVEDTVQETRTKAKYVVPEGREPYVRINFDPTRYAYPYINGIQRGGFELGIDTEIKGRYFPVFEIGTEFTNLERENYKLSDNGVFIRLGVDNNFLQYQDKDDRHMFYMGMRLAYAFLNQDATSILINNTGTEMQFNYPDESYNAFWGELVLGVKTEVAKNFFIGWTVRGKRRLSVSDSEITPYLIPGFGKYSNRLNLSANFYFSYAFTLKKARKNLIKED